MTTYTQSSKYKGIWDLDIEISMGFRDSNKKLIIIFIQYCISIALLYKYDMIKRIIEKVNP
jgi:hypothetical protein